MSFKKEGNTIQYDNETAKILELALIGKFEIFGQQELISKEKRKNNVICNSENATVYFLS